MGQKQGGERKDGTEKWEKKKKRKKKSVVREIGEKRKVLLYFAHDFAKSRNGFHSPQKLKSLYLHQFFTDSLKTENVVYSM